MDHRIQEQVQRSLRTFTQFYTAMVEHFEATLSLLGESASLDPRAYFDQYAFPAKRCIEKNGVLIDPRQFTVTIQRVSVSQR